MSGDSEVMFECVVSADLFARAQLGVSTEEVRYYLNGVHISPAPTGGAVITSTDGAMLISMFDPNAYVSGEAIVMLDKQMIRALPVSGALLEERLLAVRVPKAAMSKARAFVLDQRRPAKDDEIQSAHLAARSVFDDPDGRVRAAQFGALTIDGAFPDWRRVLPDNLDAGGPVGAFDQRLLATITKALSPRRGSAHVRITPAKVNPLNSPMLITSASSMIDGFAVLMPIRDGAKEAPAIPVWALKPKTKKAA